MDIILGIRDVLLVSGRLSQEQFSYFQCYMVISELNDGINPYPFPDKSMLKGIILESLGVPDLHPRSQEHPSPVPDGCQIYIF